MATVNYPFIQILIDLAFGDQDGTWDETVDPFLQGLDTHLKERETEQVSARGGHETIAARLAAMDLDRGAILAEIVAARGSALSLGARLGVSLNPDGTLKSDAPVGNEWNHATGALRVSASAFTLPGNQASVFPFGRAIRLTNATSGDTDAGWVSASSYDSGTGLTTVQVTYATVPDPLSGSIEYGQEVANSPLGVATAEQPVISGLAASINEAEGASITVVRQGGGNYTDEADFLVKALKSDGSELAGWTAVLVSGSTVTLTPPAVDADTPVTLYLRASDGPLGHGPESVGHEVTVADVPITSDAAVVFDDIEADWIHSDTDFAYSDTEGQDGADHDWVRTQPVVDIVEDGITPDGYSGGILTFSSGTSGLLVTDQAFGMEGVGVDVVVVVKGDVTETGSGPYNYSVENLVAVHAGDSVPASCEAIWLGPEIFCGTGGEDGSGNPELITPAVDLTVGTHSGTSLEVSYPAKWAGLFGANDQHDGLLLNDSIDATIASAGTESTSDTDGISTLLIHSDTTDGSTTFVDSADSKTITAASGVAHETDQKKFGATSILFPGLAGDTLTVPYDTDFNIGSSDYTYDFWLYPVDTSNNQIICANSTPTSRSCLVALGGNKITVYTSVTGTSNGVVAETAASTISASTWQHVAITRTGGFLYIFIDGVLREVEADTQTYYTSTDDFKIGDAYSNLDPYDGYIDEFRYIKGTGVWDGSGYSVGDTVFTPPTSGYTSKSCTITLASDPGVTVTSAQVNDRFESTAETLLSGVNNGDGSITWTCAQRDLTTAARSLALKVVRRSGASVFDATVQTWKSGS